VTAIPSAEPRLDRFEIVFVCTGNRARSPFAEAALRRHASGRDVLVWSVGTHVVGSTGPLEKAEYAAARLGIDISRHRARVLAPGALSEAGLVVGFEPHHLAAAIVDGGAARERVFSIIELADLLDPETADVPARSVARAHEKRGAASVLSAPAIDDPVGKSERVFRRTFEEIDALTARIAAGLFGSRPIGT
jgi:protein-tyrosine phosphatase